MIVGNFRGLVEEFHVYQWTNVSMWNDTWSPNYVYELMRMECESGNEGLVEDWSCQFSESTTCGTLAGNTSFLTFSDSELLDRWQYGMYVWTHAPDSSSDWFFPFYLESQRLEMVQAAKHRGISVIYLNNICPSAPSCFCGGTALRWSDEISEHILKVAHQENIKVYALYTDISTASIVSSWNEAKDEKFDGLALNFEAFNASTPNLFLQQVQMAKNISTKAGIPLHISISWVWNFKVEIDGVAKPLYQHAVDILSVGDSLDIQITTIYPCAITKRSEAILDYSAARGVDTFITVETKSDEAFSSYSWALLGERELWKMMRSSFRYAQYLPTGFVLHHYADLLHSGNELWPVIGRKACTGEAGEGCGDCATADLFCALSGTCGDGECEQIALEDCTTCPEDCTSWDGSLSLFLLLLSAHVFFFSFLLLHRARLVGGCRVLHSQHTCECCVSLLLGVFSRGAEGKG
jgi:hypothetical protein